jgi:flagellar biosynthesis/type III secretory pathway chaperone
MEIQRIQHNLEQQADCFDKLITLAEQKNVLLTSTEKKPDAIRELVKEEVQVVSVLKELEQERVVLCDGKKLDDLDVENEPERSSLNTLKTRLVSAVGYLKDLNHKNSVALQISLKIIGKVLAAVRDLHSPSKATYSRVKKQTKNYSHQALNLKI